MGSKIINYRAYVIGETGSHFVIVSERDKKLHEVLKTSDGKMPVNPLILDPADPGHLVMVQEPFFTDPSRLFTACREYCYDRVKNAKAGQKKRELKREEKKKQREERIAKGVMMYGKHKGELYEEILEKDLKYCNWILGREDVNDEIVKFKAFLQDRINQ